MKVLIYSTKYKQENLPYIEELFDGLHESGFKVCIYTPYYEILKEADLITRDYTTVSCYEALKENPADYIITLGGDGTILNAITLVRDLDIPIIGVNLGRLGFLSNIEKSKIRQAIADIANDNLIHEHRALIKLCSNIPVFEDFPYALNDFTLHKRDTSSMVTIHSYVDDMFLNSYWADGIIASTPTGSTGYNLSCGGPIIFPGSGNIVLTPVAPHNLNVRPIVMSQDKRVSFQIEGRSENFLCTLDSRYETITSDHMLTIEKAEFSVRFAHPRSINFMKTIRNKLMWGLDRRN